MDLKLPSIDYGALAPMLILFGAACLGVVLEAALPRRPRHVVQLSLALLSTVVALIAVIVVRSRETVTIGGAVAVDGPTLFLQGAILVLGLVSLLLIGERSIEPGGPFVSQAAITVGSQKDLQQAGGQPGAT